MILQKEQQTVNVPKLKKPFLVANRNSRYFVPNISLHRRSQSVAKLKRTDEGPEVDPAAKLHQIPVFRRSINCDLMP